ncbi:MAG: proteophosphoglycan precursor [Rhodospirillaceae bacterium]|nr:proteophosphoglycan precursor [Rhodospirillaceae bacterium]|tara:strand:+ start:1137 stop:1688 length:552 start_codon:yes stop_codon:yes gene_type:complete
MIDEINFKKLTKKKENQASSLDNNNFKCGHFEIKILKDGTWLYKNSPISRIEIVKLFSTVLKLDSDGRYYLETPVEKGIIDVEDAPFTITNMDVENFEGNQVITFYTNLGDKVIVGDKNPIFMELRKEKKVYLPYVVVRKNLKALILRSIYYDLVELAVQDIENQNLYGVWSNKFFFKLGKVD